MQDDKKIVDQILKLIQSHWKVDAIYLYGSRASGTTHLESDWDIGILFHEFLTDPLASVLRPQEVEALLEKELKLYDRIDVVDVEIAPAPLQYNIIRGIRLYDRGIPHVRRVENSICSKMEIDYGKRTG